MLTEDVEEEEDTAAPAHPLVLLLVKPGFSLCCQIAFEKRYECDNSGREGRRVPVQRPLKTKTHTEQFSAIVR